MHMRDFNEMMKKDALTRHFTRPTNAELGIVPRPAKVGNPDESSGSEDEVRG